MAKVTGLGGIFLKADDPKYLARWYEDHLGIGFGTNVYFSFKWREKENTEKICLTDLSFFNTKTDYFFPGTNDVMLNFRVDDLDLLRIQLKKNNADVIDKVESYEYGRFGWALDPAGNKIELWEPNDDAFPGLNDDMQLFSRVTGLGGVFLKMPQHERMMDWYALNFGLFFSHSAHSFQWKDLQGQSDGTTELSFFPESSDYFKPSDKSCMINFRVKELERLIEYLKSEDVEVIDKIENYEYGKFGWFVDPAGYKIELWEPA